MNNIDLPTLQATAAKCELCELCKGRRKPVFARGSDDADVVVCGMCPGPDENKVGLPFVGTSGKILDEILAQSIGKNVYITNLVKCFVKPGIHLKSEWMDNCLPYFIVQMKLVNPKIIITLGKDVTGFFVPGYKRMGDLRGCTYDYMDTKLIATYHPSFIARTGGTKSKYFSKVIKDFEISNKFL